MAELAEQSATQLLMRDMGMTELNLERRRLIAGLEPVDLKRIAALREIVTEHADEFVSAFFEYLSGLEEARPLLGNKVLTERTRRLQREHLVSMVQSEYGVNYVSQRLELGQTYSRAGLELPVFLGAFQHLLRAVGTAVLHRFEKNPAEAFQNFMSLKKVAFLDLGIIVDVLVFERQRVIRQQQDAIRELSTPVLQIRDRLLLLPIIGVIDTHRARMVTENLLTAIRNNRARVVVMDITGVATIDSKVANHLLQTVAAAKLMGASVIVTGLSADVAQSLVALGIDLTRLRTMGDLQGGLEEAEELLGYQVATLAAREPHPSRQPRDTARQSDA
jgi:rsbT co-antagonist protein RsbR